MNIFIFHEKYRLKICFYNIIPYEKARFKQQFLPINIRVIKEKTIDFGKISAFSSIVRRKISLEYIAMSFGLSLGRRSCR